MTVYHDRLNTFIYLLLRDHVTFGAMEKVLQDLGDKTNFELSEKEQARYVRDLRMKLQPVGLRKHRMSQEKTMCPHGLHFTCTDCKPLSVEKCEHGIRRNKLDAFCTICDCKPFEAEYCNHGVLRRGAIKYFCAKCDTPDKT